jgi:hypothetical protein
MNLDIVPYRHWPTRSLRNPRDDMSDNDLVDVLKEIVAVEGPIVALRAYRLIVRAAGGHRLTRNARLPLDRAVRRARSRKVLIGIYQGDNSFETDCVLRLPDTEGVIVRTRGERELDEIPLSEVVELIRRLRGIGSHMTGDTLKRSVMEIYDLRRLTNGVNEWMERCINLSSGRQ